MENSGPALGSARLSALYRYPVKGLTGEALASARLSVGETLPFDRAYAIENGPGPFKSEEPVHLPKIHFLMLMRNEQLASLKTRFEDDSQTLTIEHNGMEAARGDLRIAEGREAIETFISNYMTSSLRGHPRVVASPGHSFSDVAAKCLHIINLESIRELETAMGSKINPLRFRPNIVLSGWPAWSELDLVGRHIRSGGATLSVFKRTERCAATNVDPETGARDLKIPSFLSRNLGHTDFGVYARVIEAGELRISDLVSVLD
jgi:uncharacterized protein YcbX